MFCVIIVCRYSNYVDHYVWIQCHVCTLIVRLVMHGTIIIILLTEDVNHTIINITLLYIDMNVTTLIIINFYDYTRSVLGRVRNNIHKVLYYVAHDLSHEGVFLSG